MNTLSHKDGQFTADHFAIAPPATKTIAGCQWCTQVHSRALIFQDCILQTLSGVFACNLLHETLLRFRCRPCLPCADNRFEDVAIVAALILVLSTSRRLPTDCTSYNSADAVKQWQARFILIAALCRITHEVKMPPMRSSRSRLR